MLSLKYDRQFYPHIGFSQGEIIGKVDRNLHDLRYLFNFDGLLSAIDNVSNLISWDVILV